MGRSQVLGRTTSTRTTWPSSRSRKRKKRPFASRSRRRGRSKRLPRLSAAPNSQRQNDSVSRQKLLRRRLADRLMLRRNVSARFKKTKNFLECVNLRLLVSDWPKKRLMPRKRLRRKKKFVKKSSLA